MDTFSYKRRGTTTLHCRAQCGCGIWKDSGPLDAAESPLSSMALSDAADEFEYAGWTKLDTDPTCARCSETAALQEELKTRGRAP